MSNCVYNAADVSIASHRSSVRTLLYGGRSLRGAVCVHKGCRLRGGFLADTPPPTTESWNLRALRAFFHTECPPTASHSSWGNIQLLFRAPVAPSLCSLRLPCPDTRTFCLLEHATFISTKGPLHLLFPVRRAHPPDIDMPDSPTLFS